MTQPELAKAAGCSVRSINNFEKLRSGIEARQAHALAAALGCTFVVDFVLLPPEDPRDEGRTVISAQAQQAAG